MFSFVVILNGAAVTVNGSHHLHLLFSRANVRLSYSPHRLS
jgi:hypothetical protein